jgi:hypothetical protein
LRPGRTTPASHLDHPTQRLSSLRLMNWATAEQMRIGWEMAVRIEKIHCTVTREAHKRQVEETMQTLYEGPEGFYGQGFPPAATSPLTAPCDDVGPFCVVGHSCFYSKSYAGRQGTPSSVPFQRERSSGSTSLQSPISSRLNTS